MNSLTYNQGQKFLGQMLQSPPIKVAEHSLHALFNFSCLRESARAEFWENRAEFWEKLSWEKLYLLLLYFYIFVFIY